MCAFWDPDWLRQDHCKCGTRWSGSSKRLGSIKHKINSELRLHFQGDLACATTCIQTDSNRAIMADTAPIDSSRKRSRSDDDGMYSTKW